MTPTPATKTNKETTMNLTQPFPPPRCGPYRMRNGKRVDLSPTSDKTFPWSSGDGSSWREDGSHCLGGCSMDIVAPWIDSREEADPWKCKCSHLDQFGGCLLCGEARSTITTPASTRMAIAQAALDECRARFNEHTGKAQRAYDEQTALIAELHAAEAEAAQLAAIPPALRDVLTEMSFCPDTMRWDKSALCNALGRSHGIPPDTLRRALEAKS